MRSAISSAALFATIAACGRGSSRQQIDFAHLTFEVPSGWTHHEMKLRGMQTEVWTPADNARKESITILRTERAPIAAHADPSALSQLVESAQAGFTQAHVSPPISVKTAHGLSGVRVEVSYLPPGQTQRYHRVHVVLVDGTSLVHVLYTAKTPDVKLTGLHAVLDTIREGEG
jgi:hypothetical protein